MTLQSEDSGAAEGPKRETMAALAAEINRKLVAPYLVAGVMPLFVGCVTTVVALRSMGVRGALAGAAATVFALALVNAVFVRRVRVRVSNWALEQCSVRDIMPAEMSRSAPSELRLAHSIMNEWPA